MRVLPANCIACGVIAIFLVSNACANDDFSTKYPSRIAERPFSTEQKIKDFKSIVFSTNMDNPYKFTKEQEATFEKFAPSVINWGYHFDKSVEGKRSIRFIQTLDLEPLITGILNEINNYKVDGCSDGRAINAHVASFSARAIQLTSKFEGKQRACDNLLGTHNIGNIDGEISVNVSIDLLKPIDQSVDRFNGNVFFNQPQPTLDAEVSSFLGINVNSVVGQILNVAVQSSLGFVFDRPKFLMGTFLSSNSFNDRLLKSSDNSESFHINDVSQRFANDAFNTNKEILENFYLINPGSALPRFNINDDSGLQQNPDGGNRRLAIVYKYEVASTVSNAQFSLIYLSLDEEIKKLEKLGKPAEKYIIKKGDNLINISQITYGTSNLFKAIARENKITREKRNLIYVGQVIDLPNYNHLTTVKYKYLVQGQSMHGLCKQYMPKMLEQCLGAARINNPDLPVTVVSSFEPYRMPNFAFLKRAFKYPTD